jgi:hypothetical protein
MQFEEDQNNSFKKGGNLKKNERWFMTDLLLEVVKKLVI